MTVRRFYCPDLTAPQVELDRDDAQHARKALRLAAGHTVELFDGQGTLATGRIEEMTRRCVVEVAERRSVEPLTPRIDVAVAMPKGSRADVMVEKLSELGADRLIALVTERSVVEPREAKMARFGRMAVESAKQCGGRG
jgi:16S rRNA (uracil1498-N3)-methyltransferase